MNEVRVDTMMMVGGVTGLLKVDYCYLLLLITFVMRIQWRSVSIILRQYGKVKSGETHL